MAQPRPSIAPELMCRRRSAALWGRCRRPFHAPRLGKGFTSQPGWTLGSAALRHSLVAGPCLAALGSAQPSWGEPDSARRRVQQHSQSPARTRGAAPQAQGGTGQDRLLHGGWLGTNKQVLRHDLSVEFPDKGTEVRLAALQLLWRALPMRRKCPPYRPCANTCFFLIRRSPPDDSLRQRSAPGSQIPAAMLGRPQYAYWNPLHGAALLLARGRVAGGSRPMNRNHGSVVAVPW
jgi:hypothetical protein